MFGNANFRNTNRDRGSRLGNLFSGRKPRRSAPRRRTRSLEVLERREMMAADLLDPIMLQTQLELNQDHTAQVAAISRSETATAGISANVVVTGSSLASLGTVQGVRTFNNWVGNSNANDYYQFSLDETGEVTMRLDQLSADIDLYLYNSAGQVVGSSILGGSSSEQILLSLGAGTYTARVARFYTAQSNYRFTLDVDIANESMASARNLGTVTGTRTFTDWVGSADSNDYFRFSVNQQSAATLRLDQLTADADLYLYNSSGQQVARSILGGSSADQIQLTLASGTYYARITPYASAQTNYRFMLTIGTPNGGGTTPLPNVPNYGGANDWNLNAINAPEAWARGYTGSGVVVAVLDTGVDYTHAELANNMWVNTREIAGNGRDDDGNGFVDDYRGWDFATNDNNPMDQHGHGTHVAGTIAAARNGVGATGVAYNARIMPVQVITASNSMTEQSFAAGIRYAAANGADIINMSLHFPQSAVVASALNYASQMGVFVVVASGNFAESMPTFPARYSASMSNVISVGAHNSGNSLASFTNRVGASGAVQVDAPGQGVYSTIPQNRYAHNDGTSMAAPHVAGLAALALSANRNLSAAQLRQVIAGGANRSISGSDSIGGINAAMTIPRALATRGTAGLVSIGSSTAPVLMGSSSARSVAASVTPRMEIPMAANGIANRRMQSVLHGGIAATGGQAESSDILATAFASWNEPQNDSGFDGDISDLAWSNAIDTAWSELGEELLAAAVA
jgi:hypothetical protein